MPGELDLSQTHTAKTAAVKAEPPSWHSRWKDVGVETSWCSPQSATAIVEIQPGPPFTTYPINYWRL